MRWPWQRKEEAPGSGAFPGSPTGTSSESPAGASSGTPAAAAQHAAAEPAPSPAGWAFLPPLQRTLGELGTTTAPRRFADRLPTRTDPSFTGPMSHAISAEAPAGVIDLDGPDAGPAPGPPGPADRSAEMPLLPPPAPSVAGTSRPVQRLTPAVQRSLTSIPEGDFGVLQLPVVPDPEPPAPESSTEPAAPQPAERPAGPRSDPPAESATEFSAQAPATPEGARTASPIAADHSTHDAAAPSGPTAGATGPANGPATVPPPLPLQRSTQDRSGPVSGEDSGSTFDGTATVVPLPRRAAPLQRTAGAASAGTGVAPTPAPSGPPSPTRLGLGRPWPARDPDRAGTEHPPLPGLQRAHGSTGLPPAAGGGPSATGTSSSPSSPARSAGELAGDDGAAVPADPAAAHAAVPDAGPARSSSGPSPAESRAQPVVSRSAADQPPAPAPEGERTVSGGTPPDVPSRAGAGGTPAPFADPPLFAGRQAPDTRRPEVLPVVSRAADGPATGRGSTPAADDGGAPALPTVPDQSSADAAGSPLPSAPVHPASARTPEQPAGLSPRPGPPGGRSVDLPVVLRSATASPAGGPAPGTEAAAGTVAGNSITARPDPVPGPVLGPAAPGEQRAVQRVVPPATALPVAGPAAAAPEAPPSSVQRSPSTTDRPARPAGLRPPLPVVSRSAGEDRLPGFARTVVDAAHFEAPSTVPSTAPAVGGPVPGPAVPPAPPAAGPTVSRSAVPGLRPAPVPTGSAELGGRSDGLPERRSAAGHGPADEVPVLSAVARAVPVPGGGIGSSPGPAPLGPAPTGTLQRSVTDPGAAPLRSGPLGTPQRPDSAPSSGVAAPDHAPWPAPVTGHGAAERSPAAAGEPVAMRLALPDPGSPGTGADELPVRPAVQRRDASDGTAPPPAPPPIPASSGGWEFLQRAGGEPVPGAGPAAAPAEPGPAAPAAPSEEAMSQEQVDALAKRLVGPIVRRIKADMLLDRERRGLRIDVG